VRSTAALLDFFRQRLGAAVRLSAMDGERRSGGGKLEGDGTANSAGRTGDDSSKPLQAAKFRSFHPSLVSSQSRMLFGTSILPIPSIEVRRASGKTLLGDARSSRKTHVFTSFSSGFSRRLSEIRVNVVDLRNRAGNNEA